MGKEILTVTADRAGERIDVLLSRSIEALTRSSAAKLLEEGAVLLGGKPVKKNYKAAEGDTFQVTLPEPGAGGSPFPKTSPWMWCTRMTT